MRKKVEFFARVCNNENNKRGIGKKRMVDLSLLRIYVIFNVFLFIYSVYIFFKTTSDLAPKREFILFRIFLVAFQFYLVMNSLWTLQEFEIIHLPRALYITIYVLSYTAVAFNSFCFYEFIVVRFDSRFSKKVWTSFLGLTPFLTAVVLVLVSLKTGIIFTVDEKGHIVNGPAYVALACCCFVYFLVIMCVSIAKAIKVRTHFARKDALSVCGAVVFLVLWVLLDEYFERITIIPIAIYSVIMFLYIGLLQSNVYTDALTQMNNRRKTEEYLSSQIENISESYPMYLFVIDINSFKEINDTYGHAEGDAVLILFSSVLKKVVSAKSGFASRYGGDEFVLAWRPQRETGDDPEVLLQEIRDRFSEMCKQVDKPYDLTFSCGFVRCVDPQKTVDAYIKEADELMYRNKRAFHATHK